MYIAQRQDTAQHRFDVLLASSLSVRRKVEASMFLYYCVVSFSLLFLYFFDSKSKGPSSESFISFLLNSLRT